MGVRSPNMTSALKKLCFLSWGCESALLSYLKVAIREPEPLELTLRTTFVLKKVTIGYPELRECSSRELRKCTSRTTLHLEVANLRAGAASALRVLLLHVEGAIVQRELRVLVLLLYSKVLILQPQLRECSSHTTFVHKNAIRGM